MELSALTPSVDGVALFTVTGVSFGDGSLASPVPLGRNFPCADPAVDFANTYETDFAKTESVATFMQTDSVTSDLGYFVSAGWTWEQGDYLPEDDVFLVRVELEMSDHPDTFTGQQFEVFLSVTLGEVVVVGESLCYLRKP